MPKPDFNNANLVFVFLVFTGLVCAQTKPRARELGAPFDGVPGPLNAITDVKGVEVGHTTLISGDATSPEGVGPVRTGVTAILPRGKDSDDPVFAGWFTENGNGEMTGTTWVEESGFLEGPAASSFFRESSSGDRFSHGRAHSRVRRVVLESKRQRCHTQAIRDGSHGVTFSDYRNPYHASLL